MAKTSLTIYLFGILYILLTRLLVRSVLNAFAMHKTTRFHKSRAQQVQNASRADVLHLSGPWLDRDTKTLNGPDPDMRLHYARAAELGTAFRVTADDIEHLREPFWKAHMSSKLQPFASRPPSHRPQMPCAEIRPLPRSSVSTGTSA